MGKVRIKTLGIEEIEQEQKEKAKKRKEAKRTKKIVKAPGLKGGERVASMGPTEEEIAETLEVSEVSKGDEKEVKLSKVAKVSKVRQRSRRYREQLAQIDRKRRYPLSEAVALLKKNGATRFDATVELHINTTEKGLSGQVTLPHGTGKTVRVTIADGASEEELNKLISTIEKGVIDFDVLIAHPSSMPHLAKVAKILGPRGLMPNPKSGTITDDPQKLALSFSNGGQVSFRTESQAPIIHASIGKLSFKEKDLEENIAQFIKAVGVNRIKSVTLKSTMSPGIKIDPRQFIL